MGKALDTISGFVTAPSTTLTAWTLASGDNLSLRNADLSKPISLIQAWAWNNAAGTLRIRSPKLHDNVQGIHSSILANDVEPVLPWNFNQRLIPQDTLIVEHSGSAVGGKIETGSLLVLYDDLPGTAARLTSIDDVDKRMVNIVTVTNSLAPGTAGGYSGQAALNATDDLLQANTDYALIGYVCSARVASVCWRGADTGNLRVSGPGETTKRDLTAQWFMFLSLWNNLPLIPVFNSANKAGILLDCVANDGGTATTVHSIFAQLK